MAWVLSPALQYRYDDITSAKVRHRGAAPTTYRPSIAAAKTAGSSSHATLIGGIAFDAAGMSGICTAVLMCVS